MSDYRSFYDKDYLGAWSIPDSGELIVTIVKCVQGELNNPGTKKTTKKPVVFVRETDKGFALNATNGKTIAGLYGNQVEGWPGKRITLYKSMTRNPAGGDDVECLRVRPKAPKEEAETPTVDPQPYLEALKAATSDDVLQDVFGAAWKAVKSVDGRASLKAEYDRCKLALQPAGG